MSAWAAVALIMRACREGVVLTRAGDKLHWKADKPLPIELLAALKQRRDEILSLIPPPPSESLVVKQAERTAARLREFGFRPYLDDKGVLLIADMTGRRRDLSRFMPIADVFDRLVAGLAQDPEMLTRNGRRLGAPGGE
jgi:hypothetical protein